MAMQASGDQPINLKDPSLYVNRELSMLEFHKRVLEQAKDPSVPLLERLRFLTISSLILDEFFEIRVGGLKEQVAYGVSDPGSDGLGPQATLRRCREMILEIVGEQYRHLNEGLLPDLAAEGIVIYRRVQLNETQKEWVRDYFEREVFPVLTPVGLDPSHPFPRILNKSLNFIISLDGKDAFGRRTKAAVVQAPRILPRLIVLPPEIADAQHGSIMLSSVIHAHVERLFPGMKVRGCHQFRVTRNSDLWIDEEEVEDFLQALKGELPSRNYAKAVRLEVSDTCPPDMASFLLKQFELVEGDLYQVNGPVNLHRLAALNDLVDRPELKYPPFVPGLPKKLQGAPDLFSVIRSGDVLLHHPYQSFTPVLDLLRTAADDPDVLAIKMTVYRLGAGSPIGEALLDAARAGKEVTAIIELRARFDEAANIELASKLQEAGAKVVYGIVGFKAHGKMLLIIRRERNVLRRYIHLGTGNYHLGTTRAYTDLGLMTTDEKIGRDAHALFQQLTGLSREDKLHKLIQTPFGLHESLVRLIDQEAENARQGKEARITVKVNALIESKIIRALYRASQAGVKIDLIARGICCLRPGVQGVSENIRVRSVVGRFLEHHRIFCFQADGEQVVICSSADWMPRNLFRRVEVSFPIEARKLRARVIEEGLQVLLEDNCQAWEMQPDGSYVRLSPDGGPIRSAQQRLLDSLSRTTGT
jgi:polyphosphate kinase